MSGMSGASMLRTRRKDVNVKPNRKLDRKSSRGMLYENEELRLRTININAEVERGQSDIKKLKRENDQLKREISALRYEYDRLDSLLRERKSSPEHSDDSMSVCSACPDCVADSGSVRAHVAFNDLSVVPEEETIDSRKSPTERPCSCEECAPEHVSPTSKISSLSRHTPLEHKQDRTVDVLVHDAPPKFFEAVSSPARHVPAPPPPGFVVAPYQPGFHTGGNIEDLLGDVQTSPDMHTTYIQENSVFMCSTRRITQQRPCCCEKRQPKPPETSAPPKSYVTEKNIELTYDYPRANPVPKRGNVKPPEATTTTEVASTVVFVERHIPVRPKKFDFFFRSRSAPVGENEEPIYATVNKLPKRLRRMELVNLEQEVAYPDGEPDSSTRTEIAPKADTEHSRIPPEDDTSRSEKEKPMPLRAESPKAKKRKRFSFTFKKREKKRREKKEVLKNGSAKNGQASVETESERLLETADPGKSRLCTRHRPRNTVSSCSSGPRYKRDSYQEMTTSHSEHERTNSVSSSVNSMASTITHKTRKFSAPPQDGSIPWCGCWGAGCV